MANIKNVSFTAPTDLGIEAQKIERNRKMAEFLQQKSMEPGEKGEMVSGHYIAPSPLNAVTKLAQMYGAYKGMEAADKEQAALGERSSKMLAEGLQNYQKTLEGTPDQQVESKALISPDGSPKMVNVKGQPGNRQEALAQLLQSGHPDLQRLATEQMLKQQEDAKWSTTPQYDQTGAAYVLNDRGERKVLDGVKARDKMEIGPGGQAYNPFSLQPGAVLQDPNKPFSMGPEGVTPNAPFQQYELAKAATGRTQNNNTVINAGPKAFETELGKLDAEQLGGWRKSAESAQSILSTVQTMRDAAKQGVYSGGGANAKMVAANMVNGLTGITPKNLPGSEQFNAEAGKLILDNVKALGANPSNADREFIQKTVPQLSTSPQARDAMMNFMEQKAKKQIDLYKRGDSYARQNRGLGGFEQFPSAPAAENNGFSIRKLP